MPATQAATLEHTAAALPPAKETESGPAQPAAQQEADQLVRLHVTPFTPALLKIYLAPSILPLAKNISYHTVETFPEKGFGYVELPAMEAQKLKKKLNGSTLKGSKVRIETAKPEKRKVAEDVETVDEDDERPAKRSKKTKKKEQGVLEGVELPDERKVKRGWTEPLAKSKDRKDKKDKKDNKDKKEKKFQKESKYTKEPELLFKAKLTPVAATEVALKAKSKGKKKDKKVKSTQEVVVHEFEKSSKQPSFLKNSEVTCSGKPAVEYVNGTGWVDEDGELVERETGKARNRRVLELVDPPEPTTPKQQQPATPSPQSSPVSKSKSTKKAKAKKVTPSPSPSESEADASSSAVSSSGEDELSDSGSEEEEESGSPVAPEDSTPQISLTPSSPATTEVHPLEALFKRPRPSAISLTSTDAALTPVKGLAPINTSFSFFDNNGEAVEGAQDPSAEAPVTPFTQKDLEWRGLRSAAPTPDTAALGRRFSFPWRKGSQEDDDVDDDAEAGAQLSNNTKANSSTTHLPGLVEEDEEDEEMDDAEAGTEAEAGAEEDEERKGEDESEFRRWFYENRGDTNRAWKKQRRDALKAKRLSNNRKATSGRSAR
ncbi:hypothetical protein BDV95DRAFT_606683 [Massariosphaeria phaeospora]|uniref:RRM domain-containing protein n=1 Tax=Massariosphaeria phaeospora TaxID=100035 RepID=A0A7C8MCL4_9PLEO|nr:hypothetical protein BDV95DRAFT_606683 [Massariosphaeria phaeospora]